MKRGSCMRCGVRNVCWWCAERKNILILALIRDEEKESGSITLAFHGKPIEKLSGKNGKIQGINLGAIDAAERVTAFVESHTPEAKKRKEQAEAKKRAAEEEQRRKLGEQQEKLQREFTERQRKLEEQQKQAQKEIEEKLKNLQHGAAIASAPAVGAALDAEKLLVRAKQDLDFGDFATAEKYFRQAIDSDPENGEGWFGAFLCKFKAKNEESLLVKITLNGIAKIRSDKNYIFAQKTADGKLKERIDLFAQNFAKKAEELEQAEREHQQEVARRQEEERLRQQEVARRQEEERLRKQEEERLRRQKEEQHRRQKEQRLRKEEERRKHEAERLAWERANDPSIDNYDKNEYCIQGTVLVSYKGKKQNVIVPRGITAVEDNAFNGCKMITKITETRS